MGQFSWLDCITGEQIIDNRQRDSFLLVPKEFGGGHIVEHCYDGYGTFGGEDAYALLARWNKPLECNGDDDHDREIGIDLFFDEDTEAAYPLKITHNASAVYEDCEASEDDPNQGWEVTKEYEYTFSYKIPDIEPIGFFDTVAECEEEAAYLLWDFICDEYTGMISDEAFDDIEIKLEWEREV